MQITREDIIRLEQNDRQAFSELLVLALKALREEREGRMEAEAKLNAQKSKVLFAEAVLESRDSISVGDLASMLKQSGIATGRDRLFQWMREHGYLQSRESEHNLPTQRSLELGILELQEQAVVSAKGTVTVRRSTKVTRKGVEYFMDVITQHKEEINAREMAKKQEKNKRCTEARRKKRLEEKAVQEKDAQRGA